MENHADPCPVKLTSPSDVRSLLEELGVRPSRALGQNFLIDRNVLDIILATADVKPGDGVLEIGAGLGVLTERLVQEAGRVTAVEVDKKLCAYLAGRFKNAANLELICADILRLDRDRLLDSGLNKVVANLPYSVGSRALLDLAGARNPPERIVVTVQQEVAKRLAAGPGTKDYGTLSVWMQAVYDVAVRKIVRRTCFWPKPGVESAIVDMKRLDAAPVVWKDRSVYFRLTKYAFMHRRKQLATILSRSPGCLNVPLARGRKLLEELGIDAKARPENLAVADWRNLALRLTSGSAGH